MLVTHAPLAPSPRAVAPQVDAHTELHNFKEHPDRILTGVVGDEVARALVVRPSTAASGVERPLDPGALRWAYGFQVVRHDGVPVLGALAASP